MPAAHPITCLFPDADQVFVADQAWLERNLIPLAVIDLHRIDPRLEGTLPLVAPYEPEECTIGDDTEPYHTELCRSNWLGFTLESGRLRFLAEPGYFIRTNPNDDEDDMIASIQEDLEDIIEGIDAGYQEARENTGAHADMLAAFAEASQFGGLASWGNWANDDHVGEVEGDGDKPGHAPLRRDGTPYTHIASYQAAGLIGHYMDCRCFLDPQTATVLLTFDW